MQPNPIAAFDIAKDGTAHPAPDTAPNGPASYRWLHFDMSDPALPAWMTTHLPAIPAAAMLQTETRPRTEIFDQGVLINLRAVNLNAGQDSDDMVSVRMWMSKGLVVTARFRKVFAIDEIRQAADSGSAPASPAEFLTRLVNGLTRRIEDHAVHCDDATVVLEDAMLDGAPQDPTALAQLRRQIIRTKRFVSPQRDAVAGLENTSDSIVPKHQRALLREDANLLKRSVEQLGELQDRLSTLADHYDADNAAKIGRHGHILSIVAAIFLPLGFLTGLFGMNVAGLPGTQWPYAFAALSGLMLIIGFGLYLLFRLLKWV